MCDRCLPLADGTAELLLGHCPLPEETPRESDDQIRL
jgi:hypothetical protein